MASPTPIDMVLDLLPPQASPRQVRPAVMAVRPNGRIVLMGGVGMQNGATLDLPYAWLMRNNITLIGQWMYPPWAAVKMVALVRARQVRLEQFDVTSFDLEDVNQAIAHAADHAGPFKLTVICP